MEAKPPPESELCVCSGCLVCGLSIAAPILSPKEGVEIRGRTQRGISWQSLSCSRIASSLEIFCGRFCCLFAPAKPRNAPLDFFSHCADDLYLSRGC